ncbi:hypothetical protein [Methylobacterium sp. J-090]|uniref:hypothetical protein n=1 Tax=Methylobacterium sp. J-090 TaxID=2836666 RepID=UPI001FBB060A|nr:hypothetical protein [Methylobacterium sp. J-090]MCJ2084331.1 hypothetical protein [Methylobacterium sp. J-090]
MASSTPPRLPAFTVASEVGDPVHVVTWCPWCEALHWHGAAGGGGHRAPHCADDQHSPLGHTGYDLDVIGGPASEEAAVPGGLLVGEQRLFRVMDQAAGILRAGLLRYVLGIKTVRGPVLQKRTPKGNAWIFGAESWLIEPRGRKPIEGRGFLRLAAALYGVPPGVAAVRFLEALSFDRLDAQAAFELQAVIDAWVVRGAPSRASR